MICKSKSPVSPRKIYIKSGTIVIYVPVYITQWPCYHFCTWFGSSGLLMGKNWWNTIPTNEIKTLPSSTISCCCQPN